MDDGQACIVDDVQRMPVEIAGPPFEVVALVFDEQEQEVRAVLDDGSVETLADEMVGMDQETGRFECRVRRGRFRAALGRGPHQALLEHMEEEAGRFWLRAGRRRIGVRA